jgi:hypothetical protein
MASGHQVEYRRPGLIEWYVNNHQGVEQGFTILEPPAGNPTQLEFLMTMSGSLSPSIVADAYGLALRDAGGATVLTYGGLHAFDATGRTLSAQMELPATDGGGRLLRIAIEVVRASRFAGSLQSAGNSLRTPRACRSGCSIGRGS